MKHSQLTDTTSHTRETWIKRLAVSNLPEDYDKVVQAVDLVLEVEEFNIAHQRISGLLVADVLLGLDVDQETLLATLLSDYALIDTYEIDRIKEGYGEVVAGLVSNVRRLHAFRPCESENEINSAEQAESLRRMLLATIDDVRAVLIKLAWRLKNLRRLEEEPDESRHCIARDTLDIYAPLANRLGISQLKWEMEDLAFRQLEPDTYKKIAKSLSFRRVEREEYVDEFTETLKQFLDEVNISATVYGRPKHIYSIWRKMQRKGVGIDQLYDLRAVRVIVEDLSTCYGALGLIHSRWTHVPEEFDDYIANKKPNGYQSLHTVVIGPKGRHVEIQIRTHDMHVFAELGVAAHWRYKEGGAQNVAMEKAVGSLRRLLDSSNDDSELLEDFNAEIFQDRVFVLTPQGEVIDLPKGSTPLDFAYAIHTNVGHRCRGALVNDSIASLQHVLENGQQVEILTGKENKPKRDWMNPAMGYVYSPRARSKIRHWFRQQDHEQNYQDGKVFWEREKHRLNVDKIDLKKLADKFHKGSERSFFISLGRGDISLAQLTDALIAPIESEVEFKKITVGQRAEVDKSDIMVNGVGNLLTNIARCCKPVPGDDVVGFITVGRGVTVHRKDCPNITNLDEVRRTHLTEVSWGTETTAYVVDIIVTSFDQPGVLRDVADLLAKERLNLLNITTLPGKQPQVTLLDMSVQIRDLGQLGDLLKKLSQVPNVIDAQRKR